MAHRRAPGDERRPEAQRCRSRRVEAAGAPCRLGSSSLPGTSLARLQFLPRPGHPARRGARAGARRAARLARHRHVGHGSQPPRQGLHRRAPPRPRRTCARCSRSRTATRCCSCRAARRRSSRPCRLNLAEAGATRRLRRHGPLVEEGRARGAPLLPRQRRRRRGRQRLLRAAGAGDLAADAGRRVPALHAERDHRRASSSRTCPNPRRRSSPTCPRPSCRVPIDVSRFGLIYAGAQKNIGPRACASSSCARI